jgi:hypothetical protein
MYVCACKCVCVVCVCVCVVCVCVCDGVLWAQEYLVPEKPVLLRGAINDEKWSVHTLISTACPPSGHYRCSGWQNQLVNNHKLNTIPNSKVLRAFPGVNFMAQSSVC